ncbi:hypothetical protein AAVH_31336 [Aphelenchoides avenae]|nr:hypothetical protein AAVH_31336 [Aphelenchus avenae]
MWLPLSLVFLGQLTVPVLSQVLLFPTQYRFIYASPTNVTAASLTECHQLVATKITKGFFDWNTASKTCTYAAAISGFIYGNDNSTPGALVSTASAEITEVSWLEAETHIMNEVYATGECPAKTTLSGRFCVPQTPTRIYGVYIAGHYKNTTIHVLTKTQVQDSLNYYCDTPFSIRMIFGSSWFCYTRFDNIGTLDYNTIATNKCASLQAGSSVIKFTENDRECGFLTGIDRLR